MPAVDLTGWPIWLVAALLILNLFRDQIGSFVPVALRDHFRSRERQRTIEFEALTEQQRDEREAWQTARPSNWSWRLWLRCQWWPTTSG